LDVASVDYFKKMAADLGMPYQNLINLFLRDCAAQKRRPVVEWPQGVTSPKRRAS
jgi:antitoxin component of RelBE/YafQ-DinJ toxin-antitoxin module